MGPINDPYGSGYLNPPTIPFTHPGGFYADCGAVLARFTILSNQVSTDMDPSKFLSFGHTIPNHLRVQANEIMWRAWSKPITRQNKLRFSGSIPA